MALHLRCARPVDFAQCNSRCRGFYALTGLVSRRSRRDIPLHVGSGCHRRASRASKARIRLGFLLACVFQAADFPSLLVARHLHSRGVGYKPFSRQLRRLGLDVERHWSIHDCEFFLCEVRKLTESKRSLHALIWFLQILAALMLGWGLGEGLSASVLGG